MNTKEDIFDKIMSCRALRKKEQFYKKNKEVLLYLFFGGLTFVVSIMSYAICNVTFRLNELTANIISWILAVLFAFLTNQKWVFRSETNTVMEYGKLMLDFFAGRVATLIIEEMILLVFITWLGFNSILIKVIAQIVVITLNYVISKLWVFK